MKKLKLSVVAIVLGLVMAVGVTPAAQAVEMRPMACSTRYYPYPWAMANPMCWFGPTGACGYWRTGCGGGF